MKISQQEKEQVRLDILQAFAELAQKRGAEKVTLAQIAKRAGIGASTIYNYFRTKEKLYVAFLSKEMLRAQEELQAVENLGDFNLQEALQLYMDLLLERWEEDRLLVSSVLEHLSMMPFSALGDLRELRYLFLEPVRWLIEEAIVREDIPRPPMKPFLEELFADLAQGLLIYWLRDDSPEAERTTRLTDMSLGLYTSFLQSGLLAKALDIGYFLLRQHTGSFAHHFEHFILAAAQTQGPFGREEPPPQSTKPPKARTKPTRAKKAAAKKKSAAKAKEAK